MFFCADLENSRWQERRTSPGVWWIWRFFGGEIKPTKPPQQRHWGVAFEPTKNNPKLPFQKSLNSESYSRYSCESFLCSIERNFQKPAEREYMREFPALLVVVWAYQEKHFFGEEGSFFSRVSAIFLWGVFFAFFCVF